MRRAVFVLAVLGLAFSAGAALDAGQKNASNPRADALKTLDDLSTKLTELEKIHADSIETMDKMSGIYHALDKKVSEVTKLAAAGAGSSARLIEASQQLQEAQMSFNLQYLQLQNSMENDNRQFSMVSNIMKMKHDTAKNSISNIR